MKKSIKTENVAYTCELLRVTNDVTKKTNYYFIVCNARKQVSKKKYDARYGSSEGVCSLFTKSRMYKGAKYFHHYTTVIFYTLKDIEI